MALYPVAGLSKTIESPVPIIIDLLPFSPQHRPGYKLNLPRKWIQHETGNYKAGADAAMHSRWLRSASNTAYVSFHFCVDDGVIYQFVPIDEVTWQAGDGAGPGNYQCISSELCVNAGINTAKARANAENLAAQILYAIGYEDAAAVGAHWDYNFNNDPAHRHHCPEQMYFGKPQYWPVFVNKVEMGIAQLVVDELPPSPPEPTFPAPILPDWFTTQKELERPSDQKYLGRTAYVMQRNFRALRKTLRRIEPRTDAPRSGPDVQVDQKVFGERLWLDERNRSWILTEDGHWVLASAFTPRVRIDPRTAE